MHYLVIKLSIKIIQIYKYIIIPIRINYYIINNKNDNNNCNKHNNDMHNVDDKCGSNNKHFNKMFSAFFLMQCIFKKQTILLLYIF